MIELYTARRVNANRASLAGQRAFDRASPVGAFPNRYFDGRLGKTDREIPFRSQSAEKLGKNYQSREYMSIKLT
jgi:hypothetical protein